MTEDSRDEKHIHKIKQANKDGFLKWWEIIYTWWIWPDLYSKHYFALKTLYSHINTTYVFHCEDDQIFKKTDFNYLELSKKILDSDPTVGLVQLRDLIGDFNLKKTGIMKSRYYELLTDERIEYFGHSFVVMSTIDWCRWFSLQPWLRRLKEMEKIMFDGSVSTVDEGGWWDKMIARWLHAVVIDPPIFNHINPIFNSTKTIKNQGLRVRLRQTLSWTVKYRSRLVFLYLKDLFQ
jgi:hypothetical protein